jgi:hypothetical protein
MMSTDLDLGPLERLLDIYCRQIRQLVSYKRELGVPQDLPRAGPYIA